MNEPKSLQDAIVYFSDPDRCIDFLAIRRWPDGKVVCPICGSDSVSEFNAKRHTWKCAKHHAKREFSIKVGTIMEDSAIPLQKWLPAMWLLTTCKNGISSYELARALRVTQKTAWFMLHRIRLAMQQGSLMKFGGSGSPVEVDETFIGGKARNMHKDRRNRMRVREHNWSKTVVIGVLERGGKVKATVIPERRKPIVERIVRESVETGAQVMTDEFPGYMDLKENYEHEIINHLEGYVRGHVHTQGIENFWSLLKRGLSRTYVAVEPFHLFRYVDEQAFRFNNRATKNHKVSDSDRFDIAVSSILGKRLTYAELTGKVGETTIN